MYISLEPADPEQFDSVVKHDCIIKKFCGFY